MPTIAQQGMDWKVTIKMFGHSDCESVSSTHFVQNDDHRTVAEASKIDDELGLQKTG